MATIQIDINASGGNARQQLQQVQSEISTLDNRVRTLRTQSLSYRQTVARLNQELANNRKALLTADAASRELLDTRNKEIRAEQGLIRARQQNNSILQATLQQQRRGLNEANAAFRDTGRGAGFLNRAVSDLTGTLGAFGVIEAGAAVLNFGRESVGAAVKVEGFRNSLTALYGDAQIAERTLADLQMLAQLPGITFEGAVEGAVRLKTVGVEGDRALNVIREFGNAAALSGATTQEMTRAIVGFTQNLSRGQIEQDNLNQILENVPLIGNAIRESFNSIDAETIRDQLDAAGQSVHDFADILVNQLAMGARASADTAANAFSNLGNATFELQAAIGERLLPIVADATRGFTGFIEAITNLIEGESFATKSADEFTAALSGTTAGVRTLLPELDEYIRRLDQQRRSRGGITPQQLEDLNEAKDLYRVVSEAIGGNAEAIAELESRTTSAKDALDAANAEQERLKTAIDAVDPSIRRERDSLQGLNEDLVANTRRVSEAQGNYDDLRSVLTSATEEVNTVRESIAEAEPPTTALRTATVNLTDSIRELPPELTAVRTSLERISPFAEQVNAQFTTFNETLGEYVRVSGIVVSSAEKEREALDAVSKQIIQQTQDAEGLADAQQNLTTRTDAHNAALVNPAISDAVQSLRDYNDVLLESDVNLKDVDDISRDLTESIREQGTGFDDLRADVEGTQDPFDDFQDTIQDIPADIDLMNDAFDTFGRDTISILGTVDRALGGLGGTLGAVAQALGEFGEFAQDPAAFGINFIGDFIADLQDAFTFDTDNLGQGRAFGTGGRFVDVGEDVDTTVNRFDPNAGDLRGTRFVQEGVDDPRGVTISPSGMIRRFDPITTGSPDDLIGSEIGEAVGESVSNVLLNNELQRALFTLRESPDEESFESNRQNAIDLTNQFYDAETQRISQLDISEEELQDKREDNQLSREMALSRLTGLENTFATQRLRNIERIATEEARAAQERERQLEREQQEAERIAERQARDAERLAERQAREAEREQQEAERLAERQVQDAEREAERESVGQLNLRGNIVERAQFALDQSGSEADFESNRVVLTQATTQFYDAELERINGLMLSETELRDQREDNALDREMAIARISGLENTFTTERIRNEEQAAEAIRKTSEEQERLAERQMREAEREAERQVREAERAAEQEAREVERQQREEQRAEERAQREAERAAEQRRREVAEEAQTQVNLRGNVVERAQRTLDRSGSEQDFETNRDALIQATNELYDLELTRINDLDVSESKLQDLREDNQFEREGALFRITNLENEFTTERLDNEQMVAEEILRNIEERERAEERAASERTRIAQREAREAAQRAEQRIRDQQRFSAIGLSEQRGRADTDIGFRRGVEDLFAQFGFSRGTVTDSLLSEITQPGGFSRSDFDQLFSSGAIGIGGTALASPLGREGRLGGLFGGIEDLRLGRSRGLEDTRLEVDRQRMDFALQQQAAEAQVSASMTHIQAASMQESAASMQESAAAKNESVANALQSLPGQIASAIASAASQGGAEGITVIIDGQQIAQVVNANNVQLEAEGGFIPVGGGA